MEIGLAAGLIDEDMTFCPYCGRRLHKVALVLPTQCECCERKFFVVAGNEYSVVKRIAVKCKSGEEND